MKHILQALRTVQVLAIPFFVAIAACSTELVDPATDTAGGESGESEEAPASSDALTTPAWTQKTMTKQACLALRPKNSPIISYLVTGANQANCPSNRKCVERTCIKYNSEFTCSDKPIACVR